MYEVQYTVRGSTFLICVVFGSETAILGRFDLLPAYPAYRPVWSPWHVVTQGVVGVGDGRDKTRFASGVAYDLPNIGRLHSFQVRAAAMHREGASGFLGHWMESQVDNAMLSLGEGELWGKTGGS
jgi:hypothetical protein